MYKCKLFILVNFFLLHFISVFGESRLMRFPAIYNDQLVFSYAGNIYTVSSLGGVARKLTSHKGYEMFARFSPDGKTIAFTAQYDGNTEVYVMPSEGGIPKRLTYTTTLERDDIGDRMGPNNIVMTWTPDGKNIVYRSRNNSFNDFIGHLNTVSVTGGLSQELPFSEGGFCSYSPDGSKFAFNRVFREFRTWKYYKGGMADDIWIFDFKTKQIENITSHVSQDIMPMWFENKIYFISDRDRIMNLFVYDLQSKQIQKLTDFKEFDIKFPSLGNGKIVFENGGYIYTYLISTGKIEKVAITIIDDFIDSRSIFKDVSSSITEGDLSPNGERVVLNTRGEIFTLPFEKGFTINLTQTPGVHERSAVWSPDGKYIAYISDLSGEFEIYIKKFDGSEEAIQLTKQSDSYIFYLNWSPDSKKILFNDRKFRLQYVDIDTKNKTLVDVSNNDINYFCWSPDSKWISYSKEITNNFEQVYLYNIQNKKITELTDRWYSSSMPEFSADGKYLAFISSRDFTPLYSQIEWNYSYVDMSKIYLILLSKNEKSPFAPINNDLPAVVSSTSSSTTNSTTVNDVVIDLEGIKERIISLPIVASNYSHLILVDNKVYYYEKSYASKSHSCKLFDLKTQKETVLGSGMYYRLSGNKKKFFVKSGNQYGVIDLPTSSISITQPIDLSNMKTQVNYREEWNQVFNESWRQMRDFFYVENMHGVDWKAMRLKYESLVPFVNHPDDLTYIIGEMIGELNCGHAYVNSGEKTKPDRINLGLLGANYSKHSSGYFKIEKILEGPAWSAQLRSPLKDLGINVSLGDYILAINGNSTNKVNDINELLISTAGKQVELTINSKPVLEGSRKILVVPIDDESSLYYYNWVQQNIKKVEKATNGEVGYIHIPDMGSGGLNEFVKYFYPQLDKKALIIDDRGNGGGNVSPMIIERLRRELTRSNMQRNSNQPNTVPREMMIGPMVALIDKYSASDGDLFAYAFRKHNLGMLIGTRTWGGVVGISGSLPFMNGTNLRKPEFASYSSEKSEWIIEGIGVEPDLVIDNNPYNEYMGEDAQLNKAIEIILEKIKTEYKSLPAIPSPPDKSK